ncbi:hypothetical protein NO004_40001 [Flavobacterium psychrophilum]|uniref:Uncharacterized protein n=1 Tax=Flavobacterium psychrophilum TaxID=96345 RepID=A0A7U2NEL5_FLAPS|nr:hypothetical protein [Flavobacterium psychrophilum]EKT3958246.1 hypothetical protein [Flavobacterium psychrophilum]EKT4553119.1 hypothetical protein [Flavobacterium psychrophilum]ELM3643293.1 hypothetical protein [Flavobacterium psychrophilum]QRE03760.1 hypothetical protein H0H26_12905 [Flavobacterium psychrophilum]SNA83142.1 hypothetical protein DK150_550040 [Flavobacterium psychrophilum]
MKKLSLKNLKVVKMSNEEKKTINGGKAANWETSNQCNMTSFQFVSWCNSCPA